MDLVGKSKTEAYTIKILGLSCDDCMNDACTMNVFWLQLLSSITIVNVMPQFGASLTDDFRLIIYERYMLYDKPEFNLIKIKA